MLHVFVVDTGSFLTLEMNLAVETVAVFKEALYDATNIPPDKQVLLISGGQSLDPSHRVCSYSAGTETNPIFLFSKSTIESLTPPVPTVDFSSDQDLRTKIDTSLASKETSFKLVAERAELAQKLYNNACEITKVCEQLVYDQHMQHQGWAAVVANLDDVLTSFKVRVDLFEQTYSQYLSSRDEDGEILEQVMEDLSTFTDIPILPCLLTNKDQEMSLWDWINSNDDEQTNLKSVADNCRQALEKMDEKLLEGLQCIVEGALSGANYPDMREIKGLCDRLSRLDQHLAMARKKVQEQGEIAQGIQQNQHKAWHLKDASVLPDLCVSHRQQLKVMVENDKVLRDIRNRCSRAKAELSTNLHARLRWAMFVHCQLAEVDSRMFLQHENLRRLRSQIDLLRQLHQAPSVYFRSLIEVVRRRLFAAKFLEWACSLSSHSASVYDNEVVVRKNFADFCEGHFLKILFPGITEQTPPSFATSPPSPFDCSLPSVTVEDLERLKNTLPSLWARLQLPSDLKDALKEPPVLLWLNSSVQKMARTSELSVDTGVLPSLSDALLSPPIRPSRSRAKRSLSEFHSRDGPEDSLSTNGCGEDGASKEMLEDTVKKQRCQLLALQSHIQCIIEGAQSALPDLRNELGDIREGVIKQRESMISQLQNFDSELSEAIQAAYDAMKKDWESQFENLQQHCAEIEKERDNLASGLDALQRELSDVRCAWQEEKQQLLSSAQLQLQQREKELNRQRQDDIKSQTLEHQEELEALKKQMKLLEDEHNAIVDEWRSAASQDSPEALRAWRQEVMLGHEVELDQLKTEKEAEISALLQDKNKSDSQETVDWKEKYEALLKQSETEKAQLQEELQQRHRLEIEGLRSRFRMMASTHRDRSPSESSLDKYEIPTSPSSVHHHVTSISQISGVNMDASVAVMRSSDEKSIPSTPLKSSSKKKQMNKMTRSLVRQGSANVYSCEVGDAVVVQWDERYSTYILYNKGPYLHFLHADSIASLGLLSDQGPFLARVTQREFCLVRKEENRYNLPKGTNFYRVKVERLSVTK